MKLVRFGQPGQEKPGLVDASGQIRDASGIVPDIPRRRSATARSRPVAGADPARLPAAPAGPAPRPLRRARAATSSRSA